MHREEDQQRSSIRVKPDKAYCKEIFKVLKAHDERYFFYIGGNDSSDTVRIVNDYARHSNYDFRAIHIPKTVDNDLVINDHTPGYGSAARYVAEAFIGLNLDNRALSGVYIGVVMGRHAGFLTAAASLAKSIRMTDLILSTFRNVRLIQANSSRMSRKFITGTDAVSSQSVKASRTRKVALSSLP